MTEDELRELFREMRDEPVPADSQARVRLAVAERTQSWQERFRWQWKVAAALLATACAVLVAMLAREAAPVSKPVAAPPVIAKNVETPSMIPASETPPRRIVRAVRRRPALPRKRGGENAGTVIRIETADPDVVIVLVGG